MSPPAVSVVIPAYNEVKYVPASIASFQKQSRTDFEVIVVTRGEDGTVDICRSAGWKVVLQKARGVSSARLEGFAQAKADIIASTDADTAVNPFWIDQLITAFSDPEVVCVYGPSLLESSSIVHTVYSQVGLLFQRLGHAFGFDHVFGMNFAVRKWAYLKSGGFDPRLITAEDADLGFRVAKLGKVKFMSSLTVRTSPRRLQHYGLFKFFLHHLKNLITMAVSGKSSSNFKPIR